MKKFLFWLFVFFLPIILFVPFLDYFISTQIRKSQNFAIAELPTWNALIEGKINSEIVVYGSSRAWVHIDPAIISQTLHKTSYNLGINGHPFPLQHFRHRLLIEQNQKPKLIIQSLDSATLTKLEDLYNSDQFLPYLLWNQKFMNATENYNGFKYFDYKIPFIRYYGNLKALKETKRLVLKPQINTPRRIRGYQGQNATWNNDFTNAKEMYESITITPDPSCIRLFESYLLECQSKNIKVLLVYSPEYIEGQEFVTNREKIISLYQQIADKYNLPFYDYSEDPISMEQKNFYNVTHLNKNGSKIFTEQLAQRIKNDPNLSTIFN